MLKKALIIFFSTIFLYQLSVANLVIGDKNNTVKLKLFYDYACPHCHNELPVIMKLIKDNKISLELIPVNVINDTSTKLSIPAIELLNKNKYKEFLEYTYFIMNSKRLTQKSLKEELAKFDIDSSTLAKLDYKSINQKLMDNKKNLRKYSLVKYGKSMANLPTIVFTTSKDKSKNIILYGEQSLLKLQSAYNKISTI